MVSTKLLALIILGCYLFPLISLAVFIYGIRLGLKLQQKQPEESGYVDYKELPKKYSASFPKKAIKDE